MLRIMFQVFYSEFSVRMWHDISTETTFLCLELTNPTDSLNCPTHCVSSTAISTPAVHTGQLMVIHGTFSAYHIYTITISVKILKIEICCGFIRLLSVSHHWIIKVSFKLTFLHRIGLVAEN